MQLFSKHNSGWFIVIFLSLFPIIPWYLALLPFNFRFANLTVTLTSFGQVTGLIGIAMFALTFILSSRVEGLEDLFGGMNKVYVAHHIFGSVAFILLLIHPLLLAGSYIPVSLNTAAQFLLPGINWQVNFGIVGLLFMMSLLIITFYVDLPYHIWHFTHKFLGLAFLFGGLHAFFIPSDISRSVFLRGYMFTLIGLGFAGYLFRTILGRWLLHRYLYIVKQVTLLKPDVIEIKLTAIRKPLRYLPGQFVYISFNQKGLTEAHPFSISSSPFDAEISLTLKSLGNFTNTLKVLEIGAKAQIEGPYGRFLYHKFNNPNQVWVAGGIGITPFISMARSLSNQLYKVDLYYSTRVPEEAVYLKELVQLSRQKPNLRVIPYFSSVSGRLTGEAIANTSGILLHKEFFLCGPPPMMFSLKQQLRKMGIKSSHIHSEEFQMI